MNARLILQDGTIYEGQSVGAAGSTIGEVVFNTSMTGYQEILTDPSYAGQLVALTYPLIGNYGINIDDIESIEPQVSGFIVREMCDAPSNYRSTTSGDAYLKEKNIVAIAGIDVRALVRKIRDQGVMMGMITTEHSAEEGLKVLSEAPNYDDVNFVHKVSTSEPYQWQENKNEPQPQWEMPLDAEARVVVIDYGTKFNILRRLRERGLDVVVLPCGVSLQEIMAWKPDGILLSNGPGDPRTLDDEVKVVNQLLEAEPQLPVFGICLGNQLLGRAFGLDLFKLKFGHRGGNHPVKDLITGKVHITSQNHGYALDQNSLPDDVEITHLNLNDNTVEGLRHKTLPVFSVQYHPEASPGPMDNAYLFDKFAEMVKEKKKSGK
jgi:carbamoyl-phosphate synthase small subunit